RADRLALAIEDLADDARQRGLAATSRSAEQERVVDAPGRKRVAERTRDVVLADHLGELRRPVFAGKDEIRHGRRALAPGHYTRGRTRYNARVSQICLAWITT